MRGLHLITTVAILFVMSCSGDGKNGCGGSATWEAAPKPTKPEPSPAKEDKPDATPDAATVKPDSGGENTAILPEPPRCRPKQFKDCVTCYLEKHHEWLSEVDPVWRDKNPMCMALEAGLNPSSSVTTQEHWMILWEEPLKACTGSSEDTPSWIRRHSSCRRFHLISEKPNCYETIYSSRSFRMTWRNEKMCP